MTSAWKRGKPLPKAKIIQLHDAYMHQTPSMSEMSDFKKDIDLYFIPSVIQCLCLAYINAHTLILDDSLEGVVICLITIFQ